MNWKKALGPWLKYGIGAIAFFALIHSGTLNLQDMGEAIQHSPWWCLLAVGFYATVNGIAGTRWWYLLRAAQIEITWGKALRLHMIGVFFSAMLPGGTAGDLAKGFYLFRKGDTSVSSRAIASIVMDRITGLLGLILLGVLGAWMQISKWWPNAQVKSLEFLLLAIGMGVLIVLFLALHPDTPRLRPFYGWLAKIPGGGFLGEAVKALSVYRHQPQVLVNCLLMSLITHSCLVLTYGSCAAALGSTQGIGLHFIAAPLCTLLNGMPISPGGLGVGEAFGDCLYSHLGFTSGSELLGLVHLCIFGMAASFSLAYFIQKHR